MVRLIIAVKDINTKILKNIYEKVELVKKSGHRATTLSLPCKGDNGSRAYKEKSASVLLILGASNI